MMTLFSSGREGFLDGSIDWDTDDIRVMLVKSTYAFDDTDVFVADLGAVDNGRSGALTGKTKTGGVADADDTSLTATAAAACNAFILFKHTGADATARLIAYNDGKMQVDIAVNAAGGAVAITPEDLPGGIASGATMTLISGVGPANITTSALAAAGARALSVVALGSGITAGAVYEYLTSDASGLPFTPAAGQAVSLVFSNGANKLFKL